MDNTWFFPSKRFSHMTIGFAFLELFITLNAPLLDALGIVQTGVWTESRGCALSVASEGHGHGLEAASQNWALGMRTLEQSAHPPLGCQNWLNKPQVPTSLSRNLHGPCVYGNHGEDTDTFLELKRKFSRFLQCKMKV